VHDGEIEELSFHFKFICSTLKYNGFFL